MRASFLEIHFSAYISDQGPIFLVNLLSPLLCCFSLIWDVFGITFIQCSGSITSDDVDIIDFHKTKELRDYYKGDTIKKKAIRKNNL